MTALLILAWLPLAVFVIGAIGVAIYCYADDRRPTLTTDEIDAINSSYLAHLDRIHA